MKIAIFHNLEKGGALNYAISQAENLYQNNEIDIFSFNENFPKKYYQNAVIYNLSNRKNIFIHVWTLIYTLRILSVKMARIINNRKYDLILVHPCLLTQAPYILRYLKGQNFIYFFNESKREFYENTSYDYYKIKNITTKFIRYFIKYIDLTNCKSSPHIITNSIYSSYVLEKIYKKRSYLIYPGLKFQNEQLTHINNNKKIISIGLLSKIKGHDFSIKQVSGISDELTIIGRETPDFIRLNKLAKKYHVKLNYIITEKDSEKFKILKKHSIYLANSSKEPFGLTTNEACQSNLFVLGKNEGGTPEIIFNGINGILYPNNLKYARESLKSIIKKNNLTIKKITSIDWKYSTDKLLNYYNHHILHEPDK